MMTTGDEYTPPDSANAAPKKEKTVTKASVKALFAEFDPKSAPEPTPAEKERTKRQNQLDSAVRRLAADLRTLGMEDAKDLVAAERAIKALQTVAKSAHTALGSLPDSAVLGETEKPKTRAARVSVPAPEEPKVESAPDQAPNEAPAQVVPDESDAETPASAPSAAPRSGPSFSSPAKAEEGF